MSESAGTSKKTLVQPPHFLGNETQSQRDKVREFLPREPRPAESSTPSNASPLPSPTNTPSEPTLHPVQAQRPGSRWQSLWSRGRRGRRDHGARREESLTGLTHVGLATALLLPSKQVLSPGAELHTH